MLQGDLIGRIYEAAFLPELWPGIIDDVTGPSNSSGGSVFATGARHLARWVASGVSREPFERFAQDKPAQLANERPGFFLERSHACFLRDVDFLPANQFGDHPTHRWLRENGLGWQVGTVIAVPSGETVVILFDRPYGEGPHPPDTAARLDPLRPHLARATLIAARLGLERARTAVATLEALGLPSAVLGPDGRVLAVSAPLVDRDDLVLGAHGRLRLSDAVADELLRDAVGGEAPSRSIPIPAVDGRPASLVHCLPLPGSARDILGGTTLVVVTVVNATGNLVGLPLLRGLFDLSPKEARLAASLATGRSLREAAAEQGVRLSTARSYLEQVFCKTGTRQQSQLVALLKGAPALDSADPFSGG